MGKWEGQWVEYVVKCNFVASVLNILLLRSNIFSFTFYRPHKRKMGEFRVHGTVPLHSAVRKPLPITVNCYIFSPSSFHS